MIEKFKYYKRKDRAPSFDAVIDCSDKDDDKLEKIFVKKISKFPSNGIKHPNEWRIFGLKQFPGLIIIKNPMTPLGQRYWMRKLLRDYTKGHPNNLLESRFTKAVIDDFWTAWTSEVDEQHKRLMKKSMRWTTLGLHYDWTNKVYSEDHKNEFPPELNAMTVAIADALGFENYKSEAAIVNFYHTGTTLAAHVDQSEICDSPLFSLSFGQSAIFLIGGTNKEDDAEAIRIDSGDVLVMSGESRFLYHAVPRIFETNSQSWNDDLRGEQYCEDLDQKELDECIDKEKWNVFETYLKDSRINVNIRQFKK